MRQTTQYKKGYKAGFDAGVRIGSIGMGIVFANACMKIILEQNKKNKTKKR